MMRSPKHLRDRARDCLNLSKSAQSNVDRTMLEDIAAEMNATAKAIHAERSMTAATPQGGVGSKPEPER
jgi:hypothetical protein